MSQEGGSFYNQVSNNAVDWGERPGEVVGQKEPDHTHRQALSDRRREQRGTRVGNLLQLLYEARHEVQPPFWEPERWYRVTWEDSLEEQHLGKLINLGRVCREEV